jgi:hypothetical protein
MQRPVPRFLGADLALLLGAHGPRQGVVGTGFVTLGGGIRR